MELELKLKNKTYIRIDNKARYKFTRYMLTIRQTSGHYKEHEYRIVTRSERDYIVIDGLYYRIFHINGIITIELSEGLIELVSEDVLINSLYS